MGVGKGQSRRAQKAVVTGGKTGADPNPLNKVYFRPKRHEWFKWIKSLNAQNIDIIPFYFGRDKAKMSPDLTDEEREFIIREIFLDALSVDVVKLPDGMDPNDFSFKLQRDNPSSHYANLAVEYAPPGAKKFTGLTLWRDHRLQRKVSTAYSIFYDFNRAT